MRGRLAETRREQRAEKRKKRKKRAEESGGEQTGLHDGQVDVALGKSPAGQLEHLVHHLQENQTIVSNPLPSSLTFSPFFHLSCLHSSFPSFVLCPCLSSSLESKRASGAGDVRCVDSRQGSR